MYLEFLNENSGAIIAIFTIALVVITAIYVILTYKHVKLAQDLLEIEKKISQKGEANSLIGYITDSGKDKPQ